MTLFQTLNDEYAVSGDSVPEGYTAVEWPESQNYMEDEWFEDEALLINGGKLYDIYGDAAYLIPNERLAGK